MGIRISGIGAYVPTTIVTNQELAARIDTSNNGSSPGPASSNGVWQDLTRRPATWGPRPPVAA